MAGWTEKGRDLVNVRLVRSCIMPALLVLGHGMAEAAPISKSFAFEASGFIGFLGTTPPQDTVFGSFSFTFDDAGGDQSGIAPDSVSLTIFGFAYSVSNTVVDAILSSPSDLLLFGGIQDGAGSVSGFTNDFSLVVDNFTISPALPNFRYATSTLNDVFEASIVAVTEIVPVPGPRSLVLLGLGALGLFAWRTQLRVRCLRNVNPHFRFES